MSDLVLLAATAAAEAPTRLNPVRLFLDADIVVKIVMVGLLLASLWTWTIIVGFSLRMGSLGKKTRSYEDEFWQADNFDRFMSERGRADLPPARVANAGVTEWRRSTKDGVKDREGARQRVAVAMDSQIASEADELADRLNFLATVGSVAPFVGLFGTVWGIMNSFFQIGRQAELVARRGRAGHLRSAVRHRDRPVRGDPGGDRLQPLQPSGEPLRRPLAALRRPPPRRSQPPAGDALKWRWALAPSGGRRGRRSRRAPMAEINVTPLVDVMLVLLIIFMVTAPLLTAAVPIDLPDSRANPLTAEAQSGDDQRRRAGRCVYIDDRRVPTGGLEAALQTLPRAGKGPDITLRADRTLAYERVMQVMGELNRAGLNRISLVTNGSSAAP